MPPEKDPLELFLFTDEPVRDLEHDHLSLKPFSSMVAAAALTNRGPFNIGVFSGWGQGKTSVLRQAQNLIDGAEKPNVITAWVNAWQYEHEAHPIVPLLAIIINEITRVIDSRKSLHEKEDDQIVKTFKNLKRALRSIAYGFSAKAGATIPGFANLEIGFVAKDMIDRDEKLSSDRDPLLDQSLYYHAYERLEAFRKELEKAAPEDMPKIVVFIDDLDRCLPSKALHLLESLKLVLAQPGFIFVLGVDRHVIDSFLTKRYHREFGIRADKGHGKQYMDKIIQLPLDLPHHQNRFEKYIGDLIGKHPQSDSIPPAFRELFSGETTGPAFIAALAAGCDRTPRTLIRTLNYLLTDLYLRENKFFSEEADPFGENPTEFLQFAAVSRITRITFGSEHERLYRRLVHHDNACEELAQYYRGGVMRRSLGKAVKQAASETVLGMDMASSKDAFEPYQGVIGSSDSLKELFLTDLGQSWLKDHDKRQAIEGFLATREEAVSPTVEESRQIINDTIREELGLGKDQGIGEEDRKKITDLDLSHTNVSDLSALGGLTNLHTLVLYATDVSDVTVLGGLTKLRNLDLDGTKVSDLTALGILKNFQILDLANTQVSDLTFLGKFTALKELFLRGTPVSDLTVLPRLTDLLMVDLSETNVIDLSPLKNLTNLEFLFLGNTEVNDLSALESLSSLKDLHFNDTPASRDEKVIERLREALPTTNIYI